MNQPHCYEETKKKLTYNKIKTGASNQPLIKDKRTIHDLSKEKQNEKLNIDYQSKSRHHNTHEIGHNQFQKQHLISTTANRVGDFTHLGSAGHIQNAVNIQTYNHSNFGNAEKYSIGQPLNGTNGINTQPVNNRNLTFGNVRNGASNNALLKAKQNQFHATQTHNHGPITQNNSQNALIEMTKKQSNATRIQPFERTLQERGALINQNKMPANNDKVQKQRKQKLKTVSEISKTKIVLAMDDDFVCNEELDFRPVEKKSLIPEKKYAGGGDKTTSKFDFINRGNKKIEKKQIDEKQKQRELREFNEFVEKKINAQAQAESMLQMTQQQDEYTVDPSYLDKNQKNMTWVVRAILVDWMRHVSYQFSLHRQTFHIAVVLLDNYLAKSNNIPKSSLQAVGATCMFVASKLEEFECKSSHQWVRATNNCCSVQDIHELQIKIVLKTLRFRLNPPTLSSLANKIMLQWDLYLQTHPHAQFHPLFDSRPRLFFKSLEEGAYLAFRQLMQLIDCSVLDVQTAQYKPKLLVLSFMYLLIGKEIGQFTQNGIVDVFPRSSRYLTNPSNQYNDLFSNYVMYCFGTHLNDLLPTVQYAATYFSLPMSYQIPQIPREENDLQDMQLEEYCSYQTYNNSMLRTMRNRQRGIYLQSAYQ